MSAPAVHGPAQVPDLRLWLLGQWREGGAFDRALRTAAWGTVGMVGHLDSYLDLEHRNLSRASLWWVSSDMVDLLMAAEPSVPNDVLIPELPTPSNSGLVVLEKPRFGLDAQTGEACQVDLILWGSNALLDNETGRTRSRRCLSISSYRRLDFDAGLRSDDLRRAIAAGVDQPLEPRDDVAWLHGQSWLPLGRSDWPVEDALGMVDTPGLHTELARASAMEDRRMLAALWTLVHQEGIATTTTHPAARQERRRAERAGVTASSDVQIVTLRRLHRTRPEGEPEHDPDRYDHRWLVVGHWRNQPVGKGRQERRLTWVRPHVKGPDGKPLVTKTRVNAWTR